MSAEPNRKKAYEADLRWRVVYQRAGMKLTFQEISKNLNIATSTAYRIYKIFESSGNVSSSPPTRRDNFRKLDTASELYVIGIVLNNPCVYLGEIKQQIYDEFQVTVSVSTICRLLKHYNFTRKRNVLGETTLFVVPF